MLCDNITVKDGVLHFAGQSTVQLAQQYGTPLYLLDEEMCIRDSSFTERTSAAPLSASSASRAAHTDSRRTA